MKRVSAIILGVFLGAAPCNLVSQDAEHAEVTRLTLTVEFVELEQQDWNAWTSKSSHSIIGPILRNHVQELVKADKAFVVHTAILSGMEKAKTVIRSGGEHIYPTEYDPPEVGPDAKARTTTNPSSFETRYTGFSVETGFKGIDTWLPDPFGVIPDTESHIVNLNAEFVERLRNIPLGKDTDEMAAPLFHSLTNRNTVRCAEGESVLLGTHRPDHAFSKAIKSPVLLTFVRLEVHNLSNDKPRSKP